MQEKLRRYVAICPTTPKTILDWDNSMHEDRLSEIETKDERVAWTEFNLTRLEAALIAGINLRLTSSDAILYDRSLVITASSRRQILNQVFSIEACYRRTCI